MKKYALVTAVAAVALLAAAPTMAHAHPAPAQPAQASAATAQASLSASAVHVVQPDEQVYLGHGWALSLSDQGMRWTGPRGYENFRSVTDGNIDMTVPGVGHISDGYRNGTLHLGIWRGAPDAARVDLIDRDGDRVPTSLVTLPNNPGWGAWYANLPHQEWTAYSVALYDSDGKLLARLPAYDPWGD